MSGEADSGETFEPWRADTPPQASAEAPSPIQPFPEMTVGPPADFAAAAPDRPEMAIAGALVGGFLFANLLKRFGR